RPRAQRHVARPARERPYPPRYARQGPWQPAGWMGRRLLPGTGLRTCPAHLEPQAARRAPLLSTPGLCRLACRHETLALAPVLLVAPGSNDRLQFRLFRCNILEAFELHRPRLLPIPFEIGEIPGYRRTLVEHQARMAFRFRKEAGEIALVDEGRRLPFDRLG